MALYVVFKFLNSWNVNNGGNNCEVTTKAVIAKKEKVHGQELLSSSNISEVSRIVSLAELEKHIGKSLR